MPCSATTVTIQRVGRLDLSSITDRTNPVTVDPINVNLAFGPDIGRSRRKISANH
jgi:hypothetical protein